MSRHTTTPTQHTDAGDAPPPLNEVVLVGRVSHVDDEDRELPSGDRVRSLRVVVRRSPVRKGSKVVVDAIEVGCWSAGLRRTAARLAVGDHVRVEGALRRSFQRAAGGAAVSRYEVEARRLSRA